jgi:pyruvate/2-oxoglutarate dehydrogenase complex dihydrolipoamide acyltransferase (E2) component
MHIDVELPDMGADAGDEATIAEWFVDEGDHVEADDVIVEVIHDGATFEVVAPTSGTVAERLFDDEDVVRVGDVLAILDSDEEGFGDEEGAAEEE